QEVDRLLKSVASMVSRIDEHPEEIPSARARLKDLGAQYKSTPHGGKFATKFLEFETKVASLAEAAAGRMLAESESRRAERPGEALKILRGYSEGFEGTDAAVQVAARRTEVEKSIEDRYRA